MPAATPHSQPTSLLVLTLPPELPVQTGGRLIILVPDQDIDETGLARQVWDLAVPARLSVLFLCLCSQAEQEYGLRRKLAALAGLTRDDRISVGVQFEFGRDWLGELRSIQRPGDIVLCHAEQVIGLRQKPLSRLLDSALDLPVYVIAGYYVPSPGAPALFRQIFFWTGATAIIAGFFWLQAQISQPVGDLARSILLVISVLVEVGSIWAWNSLFA
jgi:hypothetical protein